MSYGRRLARARVIEALETRAKGFRSREALHPFRAPHEPLLLDALIDDALADAAGSVDPDDLRTRTIVTFDWNDDGTWEAWAIALPSGITLFCDSDGEETRVLASVRRGSSSEADRFFLELLAESRGRELGIEMTGGAPDHVRTSITDRDFLADVFVELFEGTAAERSIHRLVHHGRAPLDAAGRDFRAEVAQWLDAVLITPTPAKVRRRRPRRLREADK